MITQKAKYALRALTVLAEAAADERWCDPPGAQWFGTNTSNEQPYHWGDPSWDNLDPGDAPDSETFADLPRADLLRADLALTSGRVLVAAAG